MVNHNQHQHLHMEAKRQDMDDNKYRFIHIAGKAAGEGNNFYYQANKAETNENENVVTIVSQVYVTEPKTFDGPAVYVTKTPVTTQTLAPDAKTSHSMNSYESAKSLINQPKTRSADPYAPTAVKGTPLSNGEIGSQSQGMSGGEKAGLAIGILAIIGLVAGLVLFCVRRRKNQMADRGEKLDEKHASQNSFFSGTAAAMGAPAGDKRASVKSYSSTHTAATAPRLSLRPVTQFLPSILESKNTNNANLSAPSMSEKPRSASPQNPFEDGDGSVKEVGTAAAVPAPKNQNNVHRVQLDFKPSMDDELGLKSGQLVRMLHEYDDGWALCIRMDRSQQGVCPRTCLSKLPVKPRPQGPAQGRTSPPGVRGPSPQGADKMIPRPLTPNGRERSSTGSAGSPPAAEDNRKRSQSASSMDRSVSPINAGMPTRKPAPGQAM